MTQAYVVRAFCRHEEGGNKAGVLIMQDMLDASRMQEIAAELNFSETAFVQKKIDGNYRVYFFTPISPIDFCGHASLAVFGVLREREEIKLGIYELETPAGFCEITVTESTISFSSILPTFGKTIAREELEEALGVPLAHDLKPQIVSTGIKDILVPVDGLEILNLIEPDFAAIQAITEKYDAVSLHVFALDPPGSLSTAHCRNFAPAFGIPEESATGSSNASLGCYLFHHGMKQTEFLFKQGDILKEPSDIEVKLFVAGTVIEKVVCGGEVVVDEVLEV